MKTKSIINFYNLETASTESTLHITESAVWWENEGEQLHRTDGPAVEYIGGSKQWYQNNKLHREDGPATEFANGNKEWFVNGKRHRIDGPAIESENGHKAWYQDGQLHREDGPALENVSGNKKWLINEHLPPAIGHIDVAKAWFRNGKFHREDGPAIEWADGSKAWYLNGMQVTEEDVMGKSESTMTADSNGNKFWKNENGLLHRTDGPAIEYANGTKVWGINGLLHRTDGPAVEYSDGTKKWWLNNKLHRTDGPAIEWANGTKEWHLNGKKLTEQEVMNNNSNKLFCMTKEQVDELLNMPWKIKKHYANNPLQDELWGTIKLSDYSEEL